MNYQEFLEKIKTELAVRIGENVTLNIQSFVKNNGVTYDGLVIMQSDMNISPTIHLLPYYHRYLDGVSMEDIYHDILEVYRTHLPKKDFDTSLFTDYEKARSKIVMRLVSYERNRTLLEDIPFFRYQDLAVIFYCMLFSDKENQANILIHNEHLTLWNISAEDLRKTASQNTPDLLPAELTPMSHYFSEIEEDSLSLSDDFEENDIPIYILTNQYRTHGAGVLLYDQLLQKAAEHFKKDLIILPSSIHEVLLVPVTSIDSHDIGRYNHLVKEVNETQLSDDEILSDHAYYYVRKSQTLSY